MHRLPVSEAPDSNANNNQTKLYTGFGNIYNLFNLYTMKTSGKSSSYAQEDCGVWLDTVQLKGKAKKRRLARPISKLLNPFTKGEGYNVAVALNFTQTRIEMPKTKQSSLSNFYTCQRRVLNKMSTAPKANVQDASKLPTFTSSKTTASSPKTNHKEDIDFLDSNNLPFWSDVVYEQKQSMTEPRAKMWWEEDNYEEEQCDEYISSPKTKRRILGTTLPCNTPANFNQDSQSQAFSPKSTTENLDESFLNSLPSQNTFDAFGSLLYADGTRTSTQKSKDTFSQMDKENSTPKSPQKPISHNQPLPKPRQLVSPQKHTSNKTESFNSQFKFTKPNILSLNKQKWPPLKDSDEESLGMLFTQDSQGFRVIAHRGPLKDQSNASPSISVQSDVKTLEDDDDEEDMLFTQDSQGNVVIKH